MNVPAVPHRFSVEVHRRKFADSPAGYVADCRFHEAGVRRRVRTKFPTKDEADAFANAVRARLLAGLAPFETEAAPAVAVTVLDVLLSYPKTTRGDQHIGAFRGTAIAAKAAEDFELADLEGFIVERGGLKTCSKDFSFLKRACAYAKAHGRIARHYFERLAGDPINRRRLMPAYRVADSPGREIPDEALEAIFAKLSPDARRAVLFARTTGCRKDEVASLDWQKHRHPSGGFSPITQKGSGPRVVAYDPAIVGPRGIGLVFSELGATSEAIYQRLTACWRYAVKTAKVGHFRFHDLRHTYGTRLRRQGKTFSDIAAIMGITEAMAHVYAHEDRERIQIEAQAAPDPTVARLARLA